MELQELTSFIVDYSPTELNFENYQLPQYIADEDGNEFFEAEELLAIILDESRKAGKWVPTDQRKFDEFVQKSYFEYQEKSKMLAENKERIWELRKARFFYFLTVFSTFGIYGKSHSSPSIDLFKDFKEVSLFERNLTDFHSAFKCAYSFLRSNGYLHAKTEDYVLYIYPSEKVLEDMRKFT